MSVSSRILVAIAVVAVALVAGCAPVGDASIVVEPTTQPLYPQVATDPDIPVLTDLEYGRADGQPLLLDACLPVADAGVDRPAIVAIHGGSWRRGDKADLEWRAVCQWLASEGFVTVSVNYRLAPDHAFPAPLDDVRAAVAWLRDPAQVEAFAIDPTRIGALGASAGGTLAALLGLTGEGPLTEGTRVAAVAELSGPSDLRAEIRVGPAYTGDFREAVLEHLGCLDFDDCATAAAASPVLHVDSGDPPFFVAHAIDEFIPIEQSDALVTTLRAAGIDTTYVTVEGELHALRMLDEAMAARLIEFFRETLGTGGLVAADPAE